MRWYVSGSGTTVGPVEDAVVVDWIKKRGLRDGMIRDEHGGQWMPLSKSPFGSLLSPVSRLRLGVTVVIYAVLCFVTGALLFGLTAGVLAGIVGAGLGALMGRVKLF